MLKKKTHIIDLLKLEMCLGNVTWSAIHVYTSSLRKRDTNFGVSRSNTASLTKAVP
jgi:hypothetical protein